MLLPWIVIAPLVVQSLVIETQTSFLTPKERVKWNSLGPTPLGTREGPLLPPLLLDKEQKRYNSALPDGGFVEWSTVEESEDGWIDIADSSIRWNALRSTGGWAILQHQIFYQRNLKVPTSGFFSFDLTTAAEFSIYRIPNSNKESNREWYAGNMYTYPNAVPHLIELVEGEYEITVTYHHDIRIAGEPPNDEGIPSGRWRLFVNEVESGIKVDERKTIASSIYKGRLMGEVAGVQVTNVDKKSVDITSVTSLDSSFEITLLNSTKLSALQTLLIPITIHQLLPLSYNSAQSVYPVKLQLFASSPKEPILVTINLSIPPSTFQITSTFLSHTLTPAYSLYTPPLQCLYSPSFNIILGLHGAGVDPAIETEWTDGLAAREKEWIVLPLGLTSWGWDWHGASYLDHRAAVERLAGVEKIWREVEGCANGKGVGGKEGDRRLLVLGHSNGGQGTWYFTSHFPDEVIGAVPASGYAKIQDYAPYTFSLGQRYRDPALTGILNSALSSFDSDLYASNLVGIPILSRHGQMDDNVAVQHSRGMVAVVDAWSGLNASMIEYSEVPGVLHWFNNVFRDKIVIDFFDFILSGKAKVASTAIQKFTVTTANPDESFSKNGFRIVELDIPGRLARIQVTITNDDKTALIKTINTKLFSLDLKKLYSQTGTKLITLIINNQTPLTLTTSTSYILPSSNLLSLQVPNVPRRYGPIISILTSPLPLILVVGTQSSSQATNDQLDSIAKRLAHDMYLYGKMTVEILTDFEYAEKDPEKEGGNVVLLGGVFENSVVKEWKQDWPTPVDFISSQTFSINDKIFQDNGQALLFLTPNPSDSKTLALVLSGIGAEGLEAAYRLFPMRTGVPLPDWVVSDPDFTSGGIAAAGFWSAEWEYSESSSYLGM